VSPDDPPRLFATADPTMMATATTMIAGRLTLSGFR
jgi:hypothetical protein